MCPDGQAYVFYIDVRAGGKGYEEFVNRAQEEDGVVYLRGKVSKIFREDGKVIVKGADTLSHRAVEIEADLVVLATALLPRPSTGRAWRSCWADAGRERVSCWHATRSWPR